MAEITIPEVPAGILALLSFFAPYAVALINRPAWSSNTKRVVGIVVPALLALLVWIMYWFMTGDGLHDWPKMILLAVVITQTSYALVTEKSATRVEERVHGVG